MSRLMQSCEMYKMQLEADIAEEVGLYSFAFTRYKNIPIFFIRNISSLIVISVNRVAVESFIFLFT